VDNLAWLWNKPDASAFIHRPAKLSTGWVPHSSTPTRRARPARTSAIHTIHNTYYYGCFDLFQESTRKEQQRGGQVERARSATAQSRTGRLDPEAGEGVQSGVAPGGL